MIDYVHGKLYVYDGTSQTFHEFIEDEESMTKDYSPPEYNEAVMCPVCGEGSEVLTGLFGIFGGGLGPYTMCSNCGCVVTKSFSCDSHENPNIIDSTAEEVKPNAQVSQDKE